MIGRTNEMTMTSRQMSKKAPSWGPGFETLGLPQAGNRSYPWWMRQSRLPLLRDED
jgi:hypothetical protein